MPESRDILIATWNIGGANTIRSAEQFDYDGYNPAYFLDRLEKLNPDVVSLQEVPIKDDEVQPFDAELESRLGMTSRLITCHDDHTSTTGGSLALGIASKLPVEVLQEIQMPYPQFDLYLPNGEPAARHDKYLQISRVSTAAGSFILAGTHGQSLSFPRLKDGSRLSYHQGLGAMYAQEVDAALTDALASYKDEDVVLAADLNAERAPEVFRNLFATMAFSEPLEAAGPTRLKGTHTDYILLTPKIKLVGADIIHTKQADHHLSYARVLMRH